MGFVLYGSGLLWASMQEYTIAAIFVSSGAIVFAIKDAAQGMSASGQDPQGLEGEAPPARSEGCAQPSLPHPTNQRTG